MLRRLLYCVFDRHRPKPASVQWSGAYHFGECRDCRRMVRKSGRGYWKRITTAALPAPEES